MQHGMDTDFGSREACDPRRASWTRAPSRPRSTGRAGGNRSSSGQAGSRARADRRRRLAGSSLPLALAWLVAVPLAASGCGFFAYDPSSPVDAGFDTGVDSGFDAGSDAGADASFDASFDGGVDGGVDCAMGACRRVFVTSAGMSAAAFGGVDGADAFCQAVAVGAGLGGMWKAWISDSTASAASRLAHSSVPYVLRNGALVASDWTDLVDGTIAHAIDVTEAGDSEPAGVEVWTGTLAPGTAAGATCADWTNTTGVAPNGRIGSMVTTASWTSATVRACNLTGLRLYCFEQ